MSGVGWHTQDEEVLTNNVLSNIYNITSEFCKSYQFQIQPYSMQKIPKKKVNVNLMKPDRQTMRRTGLDTASTRTVTAAYRDDGAA